MQMALLVCVENDVDGDLSSEWLSKIIRVTQEVPVLPTRPQIGTSL